jgi:glycosyltransferase involved in cell wall biosynthesis
MRIIHLIHSEGIYGAELVLLYLAREQQRSGHEPAIGSMRDPGTPQTAFEARAVAWGVPVIPIRIAPRPTPGVIGKVLRAISGHQPDVLHSHGYKADILLGPLPRRLRGPMLATLHGWTGGRPFSAKWLYEHLDRLALKRIDSVAVVTRGMLALPAVRGLGPQRRRVIENGIPPLAERLADGAASSLPPDLVDFTMRNPTLVAIGRLSVEKGFATLLEAFARARERCGGTHQLLIVGEGSERDHLTGRINALGLTACVRLAGYVAGADRLLAEASGFVMSSLREGMPLVLLEAMQWRVPIVATAVGAIPELLEAGRYGRLVPPGDIAALAAALCQVMSEDSDARVADAHRAVTSRLTSQRMSEQYLSAYEAIA